VEAFIMKIYFTHSRVLPKSQITPFIDKSLEWCVREKSKTKSETTYQSLEKTIIEDNEYQNYLNQHKI